MNRNLIFLPFIVLFFYVCCDNFVPNRLFADNTGSTANYPEEVNTDRTPKKVRGLSYPPFKKRHHMEFTIKHLKALGLDKIRISPNWKYREPKKGRFKWEPFDRRIKMAMENDISVFLTIPSDGPSWACSKIKNKKACVFANDIDFRDYLEAMLQRFPNVIDKIQFGNEWELHYPGSMDDFVRFNNILYDIVKKISPNTKVVLGGITRGYPMVELLCNQKRALNFSELRFDRKYSAAKLTDKINNQYCNAGLEDKVAYVLTNAEYDMIDIHLYDDPENWEDYLSVLPDDKPIVVSEFGGPSSVFEVIDKDYQAERIVSYIETIESLPILEAYYFKLVDSMQSYHKHSGLFDEKLREKPSYSVFFNYMRGK